MVRSSGIKERVRKTLPRGRTLEPEIPRTLRSGGSELSEFFDMADNYLYVSSLMRLMEATVSINALR